MLYLAVAVKEESIMNKCMLCDRYLNGFEKLKQIKINDDLNIGICDECERVILRYKQIKEDGRQWKKR